MQTPRNASKNPIRRAGTESVAGVSSRPVQQQLVRLRKTQTAVEIETRPKAGEADGKKSD